MGRKKEVGQKQKYKLAQGMTIQNVFSTGKMDTRVTPCWCRGTHRLHASFWGQTLILQWFSFRCQRAQAYPLIASWYTPPPSGMFSLRTHAKQTQETEQVAKSTENKYFEKNLPKDVRSNLN